MADTRSAKGRTTHKTETINILDVKTSATQKILNLPEGLQNLIRETALLRLKQQSQNENLEIIECSIHERPLVHAHWMSLIMIANSFMRLVLKAHFNIEDVKNLAPTTLGNDPTKESIHDFMREFCNLMGGVIKAAFEEKQMSAGLSLPLVTRGFDEVFLNFNPSSSNMYDLFSIFTKESKIIFSIHIEVIDSSIIKQMNEIIPSNSSSEGEIEFL